MKKRLISYFIIANALLLGGFYLYQLDNLRVASLSSGLSFNKEWEYTKNANELNLILSQPFTYLSEGGQTIAFESQDKRYVLKLIKFSRLRPHFLIDWLPDTFFASYKRRHKEKKKRKFEAVFTGYSIAYTHLKDESGLIFVQFNEQPQDQFVSLTDRWGNKRTINLSKGVYIIQKKGISLESALKSSKNFREIENYLDQLFDLYELKYQKGIYDLDYGIMHNIGVLDGKLFILDPGKLAYSPDESDFAKRDLSKVIDRVHSWIQKYYPQYITELNSYFDKRKANESI